MSLAHKLSTNKEARIWAASYDPKSTEEPFEKIHEVRT
jgi:hypothetical protein